MIFIQIKDFKNGIIRCSIYTTFGSDVFKYSNILKCYMIAAATSVQTKTIFSMLILEKYTRKIKHNGYNAMKILYLIMEDDPLSTNIKNTSTCFILYRLLGRVHSNFEGSRHKIQCTFMSFLLTNLHTCCTQHCTLFSLPWSSEPRGHIEGQSQL
jgi:hypothetical protein